MKRLFFAVLALAVSGFCTPSQANILLLYKVRFSARGFENREPKTQPVKGYLLMEYDDSEDNLVDVNLILYGKDPDGEKVFIQLNEYDSIDLLDVTSHTDSPTDTYNALRIESPALIGINSVLIGKRRFRDVGADEPKFVTGSFKGVLSVWSGLFLYEEQQLWGTCNIRITLMPSATRELNGLGWTKEIILENIKNELLEDYTEFDLLH